MTVTVVAYRGRPWPIAGRDEISRWTVTCSTERELDLMADSLGRSVGADELETE